VLKQFISLIDRFVHGQVSGEEFVTRYLNLRHQVLEETDRDPAFQRETRRLFDEYNNGRISQKQFEQEYQKLSQEYWPEQYADLKPFTEVSEVLLGRLMVAADSFEAPGYGDLAMDEDELRRVAAATLETIRGAMENKG
jgi:hypothetical protein